MRNFYPIQVIDLSYQVDQTSRKKIQLFEEYSGNPNKARLFIIIIRNRELNMISDGTKITEIQVI